MRAIPTEVTDPTESAATPASSAKPPVATPNTPAPMTPPAMTPPTPAPAAPPTGVRGGVPDVTDATPSQPVAPPRIAPAAPVPDPYLGSPTVAGSQSNAGDAERAYQQATNPAIGGNAAKEPEAAAIYQQMIDPTQRYVPTQQVQDAQQIAQANPTVIPGLGDPTMIPAPEVTSAVTAPPPPPMMPVPADATPSIPIAPAIQPTDMGGQGNPGGQNVSDNPFLDPALPTDTPAITPSVQASDTGGQALPGGMATAKTDNPFDMTPEKLAGAKTPTDFLAQLQAAGPSASPSTPPQSIDASMSPSVAPAATPDPTNATPSQNSAPSVAPSVAPAADPTNTTPSQNSAPSVAPSAPLPSIPGVSTSPLDPNGGLLNSSILPDGNAPDRVKLAQSQFQNYLDQQLPEYQAKLRAAFQGNAAMGRLGSGQLATSIGDLDLSAQRDANAKMRDLTDSATTGTIADRQQALENTKDERNYEANRSDTAYGQGVNNLNLEDALTNSAFGRALAQNSAGQANSPTTTQELLSQIFGQQATGAGNALAGLVKGNASNNAVNSATATGQPTMADILEYIRTHGTAPPAADTPSGLPDYQGVG